MTINAQSSSIMSVLVLGAGTDYALLIVARYREEMHREVDKYVAMRNALASAGPAVFASAATVIAALFCLSIAKVNGTSGLGPLGALGVFCAALSMLTLLPALLLIFGRRAFWPFVPHTPETRPRAEGGAARRVERAAHCCAAVGACLVVAVLLPLSILSALVRKLVRHAVGRLACWTDRSSRPTSCAASSTSTSWTRRTACGSASAIAWPSARRGPPSAPWRSCCVMCLGLTFFSTDLTTNDGYTHKVESVEGEELLAKSFPAGSSAPTDIIVARAGGRRSGVRRGREGATACRPCRRRSRRARTAACCCRRRSTRRPTRPRRST